MPDGQLEHRRPDPPTGPKVPLGARIWAVLRQLHAGGWLRPRRIGCLLLVLLLLLLAGLWVVGSTINATVAVLSPPPAAVPGSPFDSVAPAAPTSSGSPTIDRIRQRGYLIVAVQPVPGLAEGSKSVGYSGFEIELAKKVADEIGADPVDIEFKPISVGTMEGSLRRGEVNIALGGGYEITLQRYTSMDIGFAGPYLTSPDYGVGLPPGDEEFRNRVNDVLRRAIDDGTWARLYAEYLGTPAPVPPSIP